LTFGFFCASLLGVAHDPIHGLLRSGRHVTKITGRKRTKLLGLTQQVAAAG
jgi:hypothetical protein